MKVAMFGPFYPEQKEGGVEQHVHYLADSLEQNGVKVERWSWKVSKDGNGIRKAGLFGLGKCFREIDADLIHLHSTAIVFSCLSGLGKFEGKAVSTIHAFYHPELESSLRLKAMGYLFPYPYALALRRIKNNITVSSFAKAEAESREIPVKAVIGSGIPLGELSNVRCGGEEEYDVALVARFNEQKGVFDFIRAFSNSKIRAVVAGYGEAGMENKVRKLCENGGIKCIVRPGRGETLCTLKSSNVVAFPSRGDTFGIVCLEAMAFGKPIVAYNTSGGPLDFIKDKKNGLVVKSTPEGMRAGAEMLLGDKKLLRKLSGNAKKTAESYGWDSVAKKVKTLYSSALG